MIDHWQLARDAARRSAPAPAWRAELAGHLKAAARASFCAVITCAPGDWMRMWHDCDPPGLGSLVERISREFVPRIERAQEGWREAIALHGLVYAPLEVALHRELARDLRRSVLAPEGIDGYVVAFFATGSPLRIVGLTAIGAADGSDALLARTREPLLEVANAAAQTLAHALQLAAGCGAAVGADLTRLEGLTARERQIATLAAQGYANVNVAAQLGIAETTVAVHLRRIYAKLGIHSRVQLAAAAGVTAKVA